MKDLEIKIDNVRHEEEYENILKKYSTIKTSTEILLSFISHSISPKTKKLLYRPKGINESEYGYCLGNKFNVIYYLIHKFNIESICDLGSGLGIGLYALKYYTGVKVKGYDNEELFVNYANSININTELKDITKLIRKDIKSYQVLYFYEPIRNKEISKIFIDNLVKRMIKNQYIFYECAGSMIEHLSKHVNCNTLQLVGKIHGLYVFKKLK
mgnify:CR=1 FL=1